MLVILAVLVIDRIPIFALHVGKRDLVLKSPLYLEPIQKNSIVYCRRLCRLVLAYLLSYIL